MGESKAKVHSGRVLVLETDRVGISYVNLNGGWRIGGETIETVSESLRFLGSRNE